MEENKIPKREEVQKALEMRHGKILQDKLACSKVAVCGLGGLGSNIAIALARCGVGHLHLIDFDKVDLCNLNRQQYRMEHIGRWKTEALREELQEIAPYVTCELTTEKLSEINIREILKQDDYICEAFDVAENKAMLVNSVLEKFPQKYLVSASGMAGYTTGNTIQTRRITNHFYMCGDGVSGISDDNCLMAPRVMICAAHQANTIVELIGKGDRRDES